MAFWLYQPQFEHGIIIMEAQTLKPDLIIVDSDPKPPKLFTVASGGIAAAWPVILIMPHGELLLISGSISLACVAIYSFFNRFNQL